MAGILDLFSRGLFGMSQPQPQSTTLADLLRKPLPMEGRASFLPFQDTLPGSVMNQRSPALPGVLASAWNAFTAPARSAQGGYVADEDGNIRPAFNAPEEAQNVVLNMMGGGGVLSKSAPVGGLGMFKSSVGRIPENGKDTRLLADMLERAAQNAGYSVNREGSAISPSQYVTLRKLIGEDEIVRQLRISNHADKYPELANGVRTSIDPSTEISFEQGINWLKKEGFPTSLSTRYSGIPSWEEKYAAQSLLRENPEIKLQDLRSAWLNLPKATRGNAPTIEDAVAAINRFKK